MLKSTISLFESVFLNTFRLVRSPRQGLKSLYGVSLYRNAVYLMLNSAILAITGFFFWAIAAGLYPTRLLGPRMLQRGVTREEIEETLEKGKDAKDTKPGTYGKVLVFLYNDSWEDKFYKQKEF